MPKLLIVVEHRRGTVGDTTFELVTLGPGAPDAPGLESAAVVIGHQVGAIADTLARYVPRVVVVDAEPLADFRYETHAAVLRDILEAEAPFLALALTPRSGWSSSPRLRWRAAAPAPPTASRWRRRARGLSGGAERSTTGRSARAQRSPPPPGTWPRCARGATRPPPRPGARHRGAATLPCVPHAAPHRAPGLPGGGDRRRGHLPVRPLIVADRARDQGRRQRPQGAGARRPAGRGARAARGLSSTRNGSEKERQVGHLGRAR
ncbi:MAG: hypothetical protein MZV63_06520 [Marinilabiliales bacterium]|nr:hypothetical protein [Marinilabiliales bacterium]